MRDEIADPEMEEEGAGDRGSERGAARHEHCSNRNAGRQENGGGISRRDRQQDDKPSKNDVGNGPCSREQPLPPCPRARALLLEHRVTTSSPTMRDSTGQSWKWRGVEMTRLAEPLTIMIDGARSVCGLLLAQARARACYVFAHGAGAGMSHAFMQAVAAELDARNIASLRYQFPYMDRGARRPAPPKLAQATVRGAATEAGRRLPGLPLIAGGKSFGGPMTAQAQG